MRLPRHISRPSSRTVLIRILLTDRQPTSTIFLKGTPSTGGLNVGRILCCALEAHPPTDVLTRTVTQHNFLRHTREEDAERHSQPGHAGQKGGVQPFSFGRCRAADWRSKDQPCSAATARLSMEVMKTTPRTKACPRGPGRKAGQGSRTSGATIASTLLIC